MATPIVCEILANLDFLIQGPTNRSVQDSDFAEYKKAILTRISQSLRCKLPIKRIEKHLLQTLQSGDKYPENVMDLLFLHGSYMVKLDRESRRKIEEHVKTMRLSDALNEAPRPRRLQSTIPDDAKQWKRATSLTTNGSSQTQKRKGRSSTIPVDELILIPRVAHKRNRRARKHKVPKLEDDTPTIGYDRVLCRSQDIVVPEANLDLPTAHSSGSISEWRSVLPKDMKQTEEPIIPSQPLTGEHYLSSTALITSELAFYKEHYEKTKKECIVQNDLRRQIESLKKLPEDLTRLLDQHTRKIVNLKQMLEDRTNLARYISLGNAPKAISNSHRLMSIFQILKDSIATVLVMDGDKKCPVERLLGSSDDLDGLLTDVFGSRILCKSWASSNAALNLTSFELIQALTGASIYSWVFGSEFRPYMMGLPTEYRDLITTWYGHERVCDLDLAVHRSIIESENFKEAIIPTISESLGIRLTNALQPFFRESLKQRATKKLRSSLGAVFKSAVEIRSESLLSINHLELIWPVAGEMIDESEMEIRGSRRAFASNVVRVPLCPGLRAYAKNKAMVDHQGFAKVSSTDLLQEYTVKALVLN